MNDAQDKVRRIQPKLQATQSRQKNYTSHNVRGMKFYTRKNFFIRYLP